MKKVVLSLILSCSFVFSAEVSNTIEAGCIETLEQDIIKIVNSGVEGEEQQKAIKILKIKIDKGNTSNCESEFSDEIKSILYGNNKTTPAISTYKKTKKVDDGTILTNTSSENCIENFEAEVLKIINSNPENPDKDLTKKIMHEVMKDKVEENCENEFEKETKEIVYSKDKK